MAFLQNWQQQPFYTPVLVKPHSMVMETGHVCVEPDCGLVFEDAQGLKDHVTQHTWGPHTVQTHENGAKTFHCLGCGKAMTDRKVLRKHLLTHQEKRFLCTFDGCDKKFYERAKLKRHMLVHTGEKAFRCTYPACDKHFAYKANLKTHLRTHTGLKPFPCLFPGCPRTFAQASNRNSHMQTHTRASSKAWSGDAKETPMLSSSSAAMAQFKLPPMDLSLQEFLGPMDPMLQRIPTPRFAKSTSCHGSSSTCMSSGHPPRAQLSPLDLSLDGLKSSELYNMLPTPGSFLGGNLFSFDPAS
ncbi:hypothetical protein SPRG_18133 [Saprolegnia parasitica CBS 223.65]|uniref:C2H2-type domain-containing protein n=1 Tax=Saprolegnia parasitica (strain CBS 223.65) TaxID=695850 RepID=A0A067BPS9_SAPPC|nr:hypothetical protein SPRG_18133 [Saprolegnia parasitica CBS 223.65]KDO16336.1 hypothetical protein SPRG_18133 [Saprolegnia parasitica CBS 223.65]|eukprot:XP_012212956.1 hypothetical protein SPRG_18133 [Saprolegnia parasitica CBS 223.65]